MRVFVINLDRSAERWEAIRRSASSAGIPIERVEAVDGESVQRSLWQQVDEREFLRRHGRTILPGEYGCYRSHLAALDAFLETGDAIGIICEDDIALAPALADTVDEAFGQRPTMGLLKLVNHRVVGFIARGKRGSARRIGRCIHGPQGSAACYAVTREAARALRTALEPMWLPFDVALERGWSTGVDTCTFEKQQVAFAAERPKSTIIGRGRSSYATSKAKLFRRVSTALFRGADYVRRATYALR